MEPCLDPPVDEDRDIAEEMSQDKTDIQILADLIESDPNFMDDLRVKWVENKISEWEALND